MNQYSCYCLINSSDKNICSDQRKAYKILCFVIAAFDPTAMRARLKMVLVLKKGWLAEAALARCRNNGYRDDDLVPRVQHIAQLHKAKRGESYKMFY